jgi:basic amino acid/polyamine antiporter, APA family
MTSFSFSIFKARSRFIAGPLYCTPCNVVLSTALQLVILFALMGCAVASGHAHCANLMPLAERRPGSDALFPAIAGGVISAFFSFGGWWEASKIAGEIRNPRRTLPLAFIGGVSVVTVIYLLISATFLAVLPIDRISSNTAFVAQFGRVLFGAARARVLSDCVLVCVCGGIAALTLAAPRVCYAMAQAGAFFSVFGKLHPRFGMPRECRTAANWSRACRALPWCL